jgi:hypothetical protein
MMITTPTSAKVSTKNCELKISMTDFLNAVLDDASLPNVEQNRALRTYHFQLGVTKAVNLECPNGQNAPVLAPCEPLPYKSVKNPTALLKISFASVKMAATIDHGYDSPG